MATQRSRTAGVSRRTMIHAVGGGAALAGAGLAAGLTGKPAMAEAGQRLEGSWTVAVEPTGGQLGAPRLLVSFTTEGVALRTAPLQQMAPPALGVAKMFISTTHGEWVRTGDREFALTFIGFAFDDAGNFLATQHIRVAPTLSDTLDTFSGPFKTEFLAADGSVLAASTGTVQGTRIRAEPPE